MRDLPVDNVLCRVADVGASPEREQPAGRFAERNGHGRRSLRSETTLEEIRNRRTVRLVVSALLVGVDRPNGEIALRLLFANDGLLRVEAFAPERARRRFLVGCCRLRFAKLNERVLDALRRLLNA